MNRYIYMTFENDIGILVFSRDDLRIIAIEGLGVPSKEYKTLSYVGYDGAFTVSEKKKSRAITVKFDVSSCDHIQYEISRIMRILDKGGTLKLQCGSVRKKIEVSQVIVSEPADNRVFRTMTVQFVCDSPFFNDYDDTEKLCYDVEGQIIGTEEGGWNIGTADAPVVWGGAINDKIIINSGDYKVEPTFIITVSGSGSSGFEILKVSKYYSTGDTDDENVLQRLKFTCSLCNGEVITVNLDGRHENGRFVRSSKQGSLINYRSADTSLSKFWLDVGENRIATRKLNSDAELNIVIKMIYNNNYAEAVY